MRRLTSSLRGLTLALHGLPQLGEWLDIPAITNAAWGQVLCALCALIGIRIYTEFLTPQQFGYAMMAMGGTAFLDGILIMAFNQTLLSLCGETVNREQQRLVSAGLSLRLVQLTSRLLLVPLLLTLTLALLGRWSSLAVYCVAFALIYTSSEFLKTGMLSPMAANRQYFHYSLWSTIEAISVLALTTIALMCVRPTVYVFVMSYVTAKVISTSFLLLVHFKGRYFRNVNFAVVRRAEANAVQYGWPVSVMAPLGWAALYLDRYILSALAGVAFTGTYSAAVGLVGRPFALTTSVLTNYFRPQLYSSDPGLAKSSLRRQIQTSWIASAAAIGCVGTVAFATMGSFMASVLLASPYRANITSLLVVLSLAQTFSIMTHAADNAILSTGASLALLKLQLGLLIVTCSAIPLTILYMGARGAPVGRCIAESVKFGCTFALAYRLLWSGRRYPGFARSDGGLPQNIAIGYTSVDKCEL